MRLIHQFTLLASFVTTIQGDTPNTMWVRAKCGNHPSQCLWVYHGALVDPTTGTPIAGVEGVELVEPNHQLADTTTSLTSHKFFCYTEIQNPKLLTRYRSRPGARGVDVPHPTRTTRSTLSLQQQHDAYYLVSESNNSTTWGRAECTPRGDSGLGISVVATPTDPRFATTRTNPQRRSSWIQFGGGGTSQAPPPRARETYEYHQDTVQYTRYGEAPVWYGAQKNVVLELRGTRVHDWRDAQPLLAVAARHWDPHFAYYEAALQTQSSSSSSRTWWDRLKRATILRTPLGGRNGVE